MTFASYTRLERIVRMRAFLARTSFSSPEPVVSWSRGRETWSQIKPSGSGDENGATLDCRCYGQHSHENESRTEIRREPFIRAVLVLDKTCLYKWYSSRLMQD